MAGTWLTLSGRADWSAGAGRRRLRHGRVTSQWRARPPWRPIPWPFPPAKLGGGIRVGESTLKCTAYVRVCKEIFFALRPATGRPLIRISPWAIRRPWRGAGRPRTRRSRRLREGAPPRTRRMSAGDQIAARRSGAGVRESHRPAAGRCPRAAQPPSGSFVRPGPVRANTWRYKPPGTGPASRCAAGGLRAVAPPG